MPDALGEELDDAALVACYGRAVVPREGYGRREIIGLATVEEPPRLAGQLDKLARALLALGLDAREAGALCRRAALDSMPLARRAVLDELAAARRPLTISETARRADCTRDVARRTLADLDAIGVVASVDDGADDRDPRGLGISSTSTRRYSRAS